MAQREIVLWPDPRLSEVCATVPAIDDDVHALISDMFDTMYAAEGRGLAAPQVGVMRRIFVMDHTWKESEGSPVVMINPEVLSLSEQTCVLYEGCLSIPLIEAPVTRPEKVELRWSGQDGGSCRAVLDGIAARIVLHELDHLDGKVHFDRLSPDVRIPLEATYL